MPAANAQATLPEAYGRAAVWAARPQPRPAGELTAAAGVDVDDAGLIYVADTAEGVVHVLTPDGGGLIRIGTAGMGLGQLDQPRDVAVGGGRAYVADAGNRRVQVFDTANGRFVAAWPDLGRPWGVAVGADRVYVSRTDTNTVTVLDRSGAVVETWGPASDVELPLATPRGLDVDARGNVYIADPGAGLIFVVAPDRRVVARLNRGSTNPEFAAVDVAAEWPAVYAVAPRQVFAFASIDQDTMWLPGAYIFGGHGIAIGPGDGYAVTVQDARADFSGVYRYATRRPLATDAAALGGVPAALGTLSGPRRVAGGADAFLLDARPRVQRWTAAGTPVEQWRAEGVVDVAAAPGGDVYVVEPEAVRRVRPDGTAVWEWRAAAGAVPGTWLVAASADGSLHALDAGNGRVMTFPAAGPAPGGAVATRPIGDGVVDLATAGGKLLLADRAAGSFRLIDEVGREVRWPFPGRVIRVTGQRDGAAWFALTADGWVWKYDATGVLRAAWDGAAEGAPVDLDVDPNGRVLVADGAGDRVFVYTLDPQAPRPAPPAPDDRCDLTPDKTAAPAAVAVGDPVAVTLSLAGDCPAENIDLDVMLVLDRSGSMAGAKFTAARSAAAAFVAELDYRRAQVGVVAFGDDAMLEQPLTTAAAVAIRAVARLQADGTTAIGQGLRVARAELAGPRARPAAQKAIVLLTDGLPQQPSLARSEADLARQAGITVYAIGLGGDLDPALLAELAGSTDRYFGAPTEAMLAQIFTRIARRLVTTTLLRTVHIEDVVPGNMSYVDGSANPPAAWDGNTLRWDFTSVAPAGFELRYQVRPQRAGTWPTNVRAEAGYTDGVGFTGRVTFPVPRVSVAGHRAAYLPFVFQNRCASRRSDIVLVVDTSNSMLERPVPGGSTKLDQARGAARAFLSYLRLPADQAAVVAFNTEAALVQGLTGDRAAADRALDRLPVGAGTRIDRGLAAAQSELTSTRRVGDHLPIVVLLTDGQPAGGTAAASLVQARAMRTAGTFIFTVGLGADADGGFLIDVAGDAGYYSYAPDQGALERIYRTIAWSLPCGG